MECERFTEEKVLLAHGEIGHQADFDAHLADCGGCRIDVEEMRDVRRRYRAGSTETLPPALRDRILRHRPRLGRAPSWQRFAPIAAAAVLMIALIVPMIVVKQPPAAAPLETISDDLYLKNVTEIKKQLPTIEPPRREALPAEAGFDQSLRELKKKKLTLTEDEW
jgi:hypothetical protein